MKLSTQQTQAFDQIMRFKQSDDKRFVLAGYAGTGKSTISKIIAEEFGSTHFCAYTGKAANVLREKGNDATTIHGALYQLVGDDEDDQPTFALNMDSDLKRVDLTIVDEYSMLSEELINDIERLSNKVLYLGDPFQLPPVSGEHSLEPDFFLEEVHRQALDSNILRYANDVREGKALEFCEHEDFMYAQKRDVDPHEYEDADQIIVGYNKTRISWNQRFREKRGFGEFELPQKGDKLICTKNNHERGLFNGMIGEAKSNARQVSFEEIKLDFGSHRGIAAWDGNFRGRVQPVGKMKMLDRFDYAYAITCHKSQGSEFDNVLIYDQPIGRDAIEKRRWLYTALTRAKKKVMLVKP